MPYGAEVKKLDSVYVAGTVEIAVYPDVMKMFDLKPGQKVDEETAKKIMAENEQRFMAKQ
jgi:hypothetical protein